MRSSISFYPNYFDRIRSVRYYTKPSLQHWSPLYSVLQFSKAQADYAALKAKYDKDIATKTEEFEELR